MVGTVMVLIVTALGGLFVAVPLAATVGDAIARLRPPGHVERAATEAHPTAERPLGTRSSG